MNFSEFSLKKPAVIFFIFIAFAAAGLYTYGTISRREEPKIEISMAAVLTVYPGASALEVEKKVTKPIEEALESIITVKEITSNSKNNVSIIVLKVDYNSDFQQQWDIVRAKIAAIQKDLPKNIDGPKVIDDFGDVVSMIVTLSSENPDPKVLKTLGDQLKERLLSIKSVGKVEILGEQSEEIAISASLDDFLNHKFDALKAARLLGAQNRGIAGGLHHTDKMDFRINAPTEYKGLKELKNQIFTVSPTTGEPLRIGQVFRVERRYADPQNTYYRSSGQEALLLNITMKRGYDVTKMGHAIRREVAKFQSLLPEGYTLDLVHDQPSIVDKNLGNFMMNLYQSIIIVALAMAVLLGIGSSLLVALGLPMAILVTLFIMPLVGVDLEQASVAAFIIALGMLVDNSIIVIDNIHALRQKGVNLKDACIRGAHELILPILGGTLASIMAFLPLLLLPDEIGAFIKALPWVLTISLTASFFISVTITPLLAYIFLGLGDRLPWRKRAKKGGNKHVKGETKPTIKLPRYVRVYKSIISFSLRVWPLILLLTLLSLGGSLFIARSLGVSFFPYAERDQFTIDIWTPEGSSVKNTLRIAKKVEAELLKDSRTKNTLTTVGVGLPRFNLTHLPELNAFNLAQILVRTTDSKHTPEMVKEYHDKLRAIPGARIVVRQMILGIAIESPIALKVSGEDIVELRKISKQIQEILLKIEGVSSVRDNFGTDALAYDVIVDEEKALRIGITRLDIALSLITAANGFPVTNYRADEDPLPVVLELDRNQMKDAEDLLNMYVRSQATDGVVQLKSFVSLKPRWEVGKIHRSQNRRAIIVRGYLKEGFLANNILKEALPQIEKISLPSGYKLEVEGEEKERKKTFADLTRIFIITVGGLFFILILQFGTFRQALVILGSIPLAVIGAILGLYLTSNPFGFSAFIGLIALAGIVIKNAVVWVECVVTEVGAGTAYRDAVVAAGVARLRPILLTAATTIGGLLPLALWGGAMWTPMAWTMIFGLSVSTLLTLIIIPVIYYKVVSHTPPPKDDNAAPEAA